MAHVTNRQKLLNGATANDGTGDTLRAAADKINTNFSTIFESLYGDSVVAHDDFHISTNGTIFFGDSASGHPTKFVGDVSSGSMKTITLPNHTGNVVVDTATQTLTNKTIVSPKINTIYDSVGNEVLLLSGENAANYINIKSGDATTGPAIAVTGDSADVDLLLQPLNGGVVRSTCQIIMGHEVATTSGAVDPSVPITLITAGSNISLTCSDGTNIGQTKKFVSTTSNGALVTPENFGSGSSFFVDGARGVEVMWVGNNWIAMGFDSASQTRINQ